MTLSTHLVRCQYQLFLRTVLQRQVVFGAALHPPVLHEGVGGADVKRIVTNRDIVIFNGGIAECLRPVIDVVNNDPTPG